MDLVALLCCLALALALRGVTGTWAHPASLFAAAWTLFLSIPTLLVPEFHPLPGTAWYIVAAIVCVGLSSLLSIRPVDVTPNGIWTSRRLRWFVAGGTVAAALSALITQRANGVSIGRTLSLDAITRAARAITVVRYDGSMTSPALSTVLLGFTFGAALVAPFVAARMAGWRRAAWTVAPAAGGAVYAALTTARAPFLIAAAITVASWLTAKAVTDGGRPKVRARSWMPLLVAVAGVVGVFAFASATRAGGVSIERLTRSMGIYAGGSLPAFEAWQRDAPPEMPTFGVETFAGISQFFIGDLSLGGARSDFTNIGGGMSTNVYSLLRVLAEDFTFSGALLALAVMAVAAATAYRAAVLRRSVIGAVIVAAWGAFVLFAQTTSIFTFANVCFGFGVGGFLLVRSARLVAPGTEHEHDSAPASVKRRERSRKVTPRRQGRHAGRIMFPM